MKNNDHDLDYLSIRKKINVCTWYKNRQLRNRQKDRKTDRQRHRIRHAIRWDTDSWHCRQIDKDKDTSDSHQLSLRWETWLFQQMYILSIFCMIIMCRSRGRTGGPDTPLKNHKNIGFLSNTGLSPPEKSQSYGTKSAFNVGPSSARQWNAV